MSRIEKSGDHQSQYLPSQQPHHSAKEDNQFKTIINEYVQSKKPTIKPSIEEKIKFIIEHMPDVEEDIKFMSNVQIEEFYSELVKEVSKTDGNKCIQKSGMDEEGKKYFFPDEDAHAEEDKQPSTMIKVQNSPQESCAQFICEPEKKEKEEIKLKKGKVGEGKKEKDYGKEDQALGIREIRKILLRSIEPRLAKMVMKLNDTELMSMYQEIKKGETSMRQNGSYKKQIQNYFKTRSAHQEPLPLREDSSSEEDNEESCKRLYSISQQAVEFDEDGNFTNLNIFTTKKMVNLNDGSGFRKFRKIEEVKEKIKGIEKLMQIVRSASDD